MKKIISAIMAVAMTAGIMASMTVVHAEVTIQGSGTESDPYLISTVDDWTKVTGKNGYYKLTSDISPSSAFKSVNDIVLDMNGFNITTNLSKIFDFSGNLTIKNTAEGKESKIHSTNTGNNTYTLMLGTANVNIENVSIISDNGQAICVGSNGSDITLNIKNSKISGGNYGVNLTRGITTIENTEITGKGYLIATSGTANLTIDSGKFDYSGTVNGITVSGTSTVTINGGTFTNHNKGRGVINNPKGFAGTLTINGGIFENTAEGGYSILDGDEGTAPVINITGGTFKSEFGKSKPATSTTNITITGGTFSFEPKDYVDAKSYDVKANADNTWTVTKKGGEVEPEPEKETKYYTVNCGDKAGSYSKVAVKASNGEKEATATKDLATQVTLAEGAGVIGSIGIAVEEIPKDTTFEIISVTLE